MGMIEKMLAKQGGRRPPSFYLDYQKQLWPFLREAGIHPRPNGGPLDREEIDAIAEFADRGTPPSEFVSWVVARRQAKTTAGEEAVLPSVQTKPSIVDASRDLASLLGDETPVIMPRAPLIVPAVGIHEDVPENVYHRQWDAVSNSRLSILYEKTPAHLREAIDNPPHDTPSTIFGRAIHSAILTPGEFRSYVRGPEHDRRSNKNKDAWEELEAEYGADHVLKPAMYDAVMQIRSAVQSRPFIMALLVGGDHKSELSIAWDDEKTGLRCKARLDHISPDIVTPEGAGAIVDVKSTEDASYEAFVGSIWKYGYHRQAAKYLDGAWKVGLEIPHFVWIAVEKKPPFGIGLYRADSVMLAAGKSQLEMLMQVYAKSVSTGVWPCYPEEVLDVSLPTWAISRIDQETKGMIS